jgi:hypothetical protein
VQLLKCCCWYQLPCLCRVTISWHFRRVCSHTFFFQPIRPTDNIIILCYILRFLWLRPYDTWHCFLLRFDWVYETHPDGFFLGGGSATPCASPPPWPSMFSDYSFWVHHLVNRDDRQLLARAMASDFSVAWQCLSKRTFIFFVMDQTPRPHCPISSLTCMYLYSENN